jgi:hypothetical protein
MAENEGKTESADSGFDDYGLEMAYKLWVKDRFVDVNGIEDIMEEVFHMYIKDRELLTEALMSRFLQVNEINLALKKEYRTALIDEYERRQLPYL